jgi:hypothetical protein
MQLCINVQLPPEFGGLAGEAIYIGTLLLTRGGTRMPGLQRRALSR